MDEDGNVQAIDYDDGLVERAPIRRPLRREAAKDPIDVDQQPINVDSDDEDVQPAAKRQRSAEPAAAVETAAAVDDEVQYKLVGRLLAFVLILGDGSLGLRLREALTAMGLGESRIVALSQMDGVSERRLDERACDWTEVMDPITTWAVSVEADAEANLAWPALRHEPFGLPDEAFKHDGKLTKREVRSISLSAQPSWYGTLGISQEED